MQNSSQTRASLYWDWETHEILQGSQMCPWLWPWLRQYCFEGRRKVRMISLIGLFVMTIVEGGWLQKNLSEFYSTILYKWYKLYVSAREDGRGWNLLYNASSYSEYHTSQVCIVRGTDYGVLEPGTSGKRAWEPSGLSFLDFHPIG
jgi:hypothetical protein